MRRGTLVAVASCAAALTTSGLAGDDGVPIPGDDFVVTGDVKIRPGVYRIADANGDGVLHVKGDGTKLDLTGVTLIGAAEGALPDTFAGVGVAVDGAKDVSITGGAVRGFKIGVRAHGCPNFGIHDLDASGNFRQHLRSTIEREDESDWLFGHENDDGHWERDYGAGIALKDCFKPTVARCVVHTGQNGLLLDRSDDAEVYDNDFSFNSGWGIALWRTSDSVICRNRADWCVRGYSHGRYARGQDSAGIFVFEQCSRNVFVLNSATHGGDGFFLYAGNETLQKTGKGGCNDNVIWHCDFSHAVANGVEATFSRGNVISRNLIDDCAHAVWAGYSSKTEVYGNVIRRCENGVSIEHGQRNWISTNAFEDCGFAVNLWWDEDADLATSAFARGRDLRSASNRIGPDNTFVGNGVDVRLDRDTDSWVYTNLYGSAPVHLLDTAAGWRVKDEPLPPPAGTGGELATRLLDGRWMLLSPDLGGYQAPGDADPFATSNTVVGRRFILVDDWGPIPPTETRLFPATIDAVGMAKLSALGVEGAFNVESLSAGFGAEPRTGNLPATITVWRKDDGPGPKPFEIVVRTGGDVRRARGTIEAMPWDVSFFKWATDPRLNADAWNTLLAGRPDESRRVHGLDLDWKGDAVSKKVGGDRFGTLATAEIETAAGPWRLSTVSDDGIRVWVDGKLVLDDWTHHGPTPHDADLELTAGKHAVRVEHFEIDGWAILRVSLAPRGN